MSWRDTFAGLGAAGLGVPSAGAGASPGTGPQGQNAGQLEPNSRAANMAAGVPYQLVTAWPPRVRIANSPDIVYFCRQRTLVFSGAGIAAGTTTLQFQFSLPTIIIARTGWGFLADNVTGLPIGRTGLDTWRVQMFRAGSQSDLIDAGGGGNQNPQLNTIASNLVGTAQLPSFFPGNGLFVDTGSFINVTVQTLFVGLEVHFSLFCLEEYGPSRG